MLDAQSGTLTSVGSARAYRTPDKSEVYGTYEYSGRRPDNSYADTGGSSRFFPTFKYQAKAPGRERPSYIAADGTKVSHSTVKPLELMQWLVRLVTPPGGTVLDPFSGSGATAEACILEGFECIAIERDATYLPLIAARVNRQAPVQVQVEDYYDRWTAAMKIPEAPIDLTTIPALVLAEVIRRLDLACQAQPIVAPKSTMKSQTFMGQGELFEL